MTQGCSMTQGCNTWLIGGLVGPQPRRHSWLCAPAEQLRASRPHAHGAAARPPPAAARPGALQVTAVRTLLSNTYSLNGSVIIRNP